MNANTKTIMNISVLTFLLMAASSRCFAEMTEGGNSTNGQYDLQFELSDAASGANPLSDRDEYFIYLRSDPVGGTAVTDSLVLVRLTQDGLESRPVYSRNNLHIDWHPLGVCHGKLYGVKLGVLVSIDLETGAARELDQGIESFVWLDRRLYAFVRQPGGDPLLRAYDANAEAYRDISSRAYSEIVPSKSGGVPPLQISPDHKWLAYFCRSNSFIPSHMYQLRMIAVEAGTFKASETWVGAREFITGGGEIADGPPFGWLDSRTLLVVRDASRNHRSMMRVNVKPGQSRYAAEDGLPEMILARVDIDSGRMTDIARLPQFDPEIGEPFFRVAHEDKVPRLALGRLGQYRVDLLEGRLVEDAGIGGGYSYRRGNFAEGLFFKVSFLDRGRAIPEVAVSPDGRKVVWQVRPHRQPLQGSYESKIRVHEVRSGEPRTVATEWIPGAWDDRHRSFEGNLLWISARDLKPSSLINPPAGWSRFSPQPYPAGN